MAEREGGRRENDFIQTMNEVRGSIKFMFEINRGYILNCEPCKNYSSRVYE